MSAPAPSGSSSSSSSQTKSLAHSSSTPTHKYDANNFITPDYYRNKKQIGIGAYGIIVSAEDTRINQKVAIKKIEKAFEHRTDMKRTLREMRILTQLNHDNLLSIKDIFKPPSFSNFNDVYWVSELYDTDLYKVMTSPQKLTDDHIQYFLYQILRGLKYIHTANVIHRDLKPSNLLLNRNCDLKICDFGLARSNLDQENHLMTEYVVTRWYRAPEIILTSKKYTNSVDIWAVGCIFAEMLSRRPLLPGKDYLHQLRLMVDILGNFKDEDLKQIESENAKKYVKSLPIRRKMPWSEYFAKYNVTITPEAANLLDRMLVLDPEKRITADEALAHPYLASLHDPASEPSAEGVSFNFDYEDYLTAENLKHLIFQEMLKFHRESVSEFGYNPSPEIWAISEIANPGFLTELGLTRPSTLPTLVKTIHPPPSSPADAAAQKDKDKAAAAANTGTPQKAAAAPAAAPPKAGSSSAGGKSSTRPSSGSAKK